MINKNTLQIATQSSKTLLAIQGITNRGVEEQINNTAT